MVTFRNCSSETTVEDGQSLRLTFSAAGLVPSLFSKYAASAFQKLFVAARVIPIQPPSVLIGATATTFDVNNKMRRPAGVIAREIQFLDSNFHELSEVQLLTARQKSLSNTPAGEAERTGARVKQEAVNADSSIANTLKKMFENFGRAAQVTVIIVVIALALIYIPRRK